MSISLTSSPIVRVDIAKRGPGYKVTTPGIFLNMPGEMYHADPCPEPSLSSSIGKILVEQTAAAAWLNHPKLNPNFKPDDLSKFDLGKAAHDIMLCGAGLVQALDYGDYKSKDARAARDKAIVAGKIPILKAKLADCITAVKAWRFQLDRQEEDSMAFKLGYPEVTIIWQEIIFGRTIWCRIRLDWLHFTALQDRPTNLFHDLKSSGIPVGPDDWSRPFFSLRYDFQAEFYKRGIRAILGVRHPLFRFVAGEIDPPYGLMVHELSAEDGDAAAVDVEIALARWAWCIGHDSWPNWPNRTNYLSAPVWHARLLEERKMSHHLDIKDPKHFDIVNEYYAPSEISTDKE